MCGMLTGPSAGRLLAPMAPKSSSRPIPNASRRPYPSSVLICQRALQRRYVAQRSDLGFEKPAVARKEVGHATGECLIFRDVVFVPRGGVLSPLTTDRAHPFPEARQPRWRLHRGLGFRRHVLEKLVHVRHVPGAVDAYRVVLVLHLTDVARRAVQSDHLVAIQLRAAERDPDWQAIRIALVPGHREESQSVRCCREIAGRERCHRSPALSTSSASSQSRGKSSPPSDR